MRNDEPDDLERDEAANESADDAPSEGYAWGFARQEKELPASEYRAHMRLLDEIDEDDLETLDLSGASDYILWGAAQAFEELERLEDAIALMRRLAASRSPHPALYYPDILLRLAEWLKDRGDYDEALEALDGVERLEGELRLACDERRAEILVLRGQFDQGVRLFEETMRALPGDPWVPLRAAWALLTSGRFADVPRFIERSEKELKKMRDEEDARAAASEIGRLRGEAEARRARSVRLEAPSTDPVSGLESVKEEILAALDAEEARLSGHPPRSDDARARALERLVALHERASKGWDDAVEAQDETLIAEFDELQWDVVGLAGRFGLKLPGVDAD